MKFIDEVTFHVKAGDGGQGCVSFYRGKGVPHGGPDGGDGGNGGSVYFYVDESVSTLLDLRFTRKIEARRGEQGYGKECNGRAAENVRVRVPRGTLVWNALTSELIADLDEVGKEVKVAQGGRGGLGNMNFATSTRQAPRFAQPGTPGEELDLRLELRLLADVGIIGFPNVGKSTLISHISAAKPKIADYPFTTLVPKLGVVRVGEGSSFVVADIPGLIPGASDGAGLGFQFLRHVARVSMFVHMVAFDWGDGRDPVADYEYIRKELGKFDPDLLNKPEIIVMNKADLNESREGRDKLVAFAKKKKRELLTISAVTGQGVQELIYSIAAMTKGEAVAAKARALDAEKTMDQRRPALDPERAVEMKRPSVMPNPHEAETLDLTGDAATVRTQVLPGAGRNLAMKTAPAAKTAAKKRGAKKAPVKKAIEKKAKKKASAKRLAPKKKARSHTPPKKTSVKKTSVKRTRRKKSTAKMAASKPKPRAQQGA